MQRCVTVLLLVVAGMLFLRPLPGAGQTLSVDVHAHRGGKGLGPENTLAAIRASLALGVDVLELDMQVSADGEIVIIHDATCNRTTNGKGFVRAMSLAEIRRLDAGSWFAPRFAGERIPTLREVIQTVRAVGNKSARLNIETKYDSRGPSSPPDFEARVLDVLRREQWLDRVIIQSFHYPSLERVKQLEPRVVTAVLHSPLIAFGDPLQVVRSAHADIYSPSARLVTRDTVGHLHQEGIPIVPWTVNDPSAVERLLKTGIGTLKGDGIISDHPDRLIQVLRARGLRR